LLLRICLEKDCSVGHRIGGRNVYLSEKFVIKRLEVNPSVFKWKHTEQIRRKCP
jgi:hypothetical protein